MSNNLSCEKCGPVMKGTVVSPALPAAREGQPQEEVRDALDWLVHLGHGVGRAGYAPEHGEIEAALETR